MPRHQNEEQAKIAKLTPEELATELANKEKEVEVLRKRDQELYEEKLKQLQKRQQENIDKLIEALTENETKVNAAKDAYERRCSKANARPAILSQADQDLRAKLIELESAMNLFRRNLELPNGCPRKLEEVKVFKVQYLKAEQEKEARAKVSEQEHKKAQEKYKAEDELYRLNNEKTKRETEAKQAKINTYDTKLTENAHKKYGFMHKTVGAVIAVAICLLITQTIPVTAAAYIILTGAALFGAGIGQTYRNSVIDAGKIYRSKEDVESLDLLDKSYRPEIRTQALKAGVEAATWKGYLKSFKPNNAGWDLPLEFRAGMIQAITENEEVVTAIRNRK
jgi:hypothetical protein